MITPLPGELGTCDGCHEPVLWTRTVPNNAVRPVNPTPDPEGRTAVYRDEAGRLRARQLNRERPVPEAAEQLHMTHHATCPAPRQTPRPRRPARPQRRGWPHPGWRP